MKTLMNSRWLISCFVFFAITAIAADNPRSRSWIAERCAAYRTSYCEVPFSVVLARTEEMRGRRIRIKGYLIQEDGKYSIYPNKEAADLILHESALELEPTADTEINFTLNRLNKSDVQLNGQVKLATSGVNSRWALFTLEEPADFGFHRMESTEEDRRVR